MMWEGKLRDTQAQSDKLETQLKEREKLIAEQR